MELFLKLKELFLYRYCSHVPEVLELSCSLGEIPQSDYTALMVGSVLDLVSQVCDVVLVRRTFSSRKPQGVGILEWGGNGEGMEMGRSVYEQPRWTGSYHSKEGFQVSKGKWKGGKKESEKGKQKARGLRHSCIVNLYACT